MLQQRALDYSIRLGLLTTIAALAACTKPAENNELNWARAALERNPQLKVLSSDNVQNTLQIRVKATGETLTVTPGELVAMPIGDLISLTAATRVDTPTLAAAVAPEPTPTAVPPPPVEPTTIDAPKPEYTVQREDGRVRVTGPGVSIETHKPSAQANASNAPRFDEPILCDGKRMLHFDNRRINVDGDAITVRAGCELHITNSRIVATGTAITVLDATVHIANSEITGSEGSLTTSSAAHALFRNSTFTGLVRRDPQAQMQDQGGNTWR